MIRVSWINVCHGCCCNARHAEVLVQLQFTTELQLPSFHGLDLALSPPYSKDSKYYLRLAAEERLLLFRDIAATVISNYRSRLWPRLIVHYVATVVGVATCRNSYL